MQLSNTDVLLRLREMRDEMNALIDQMTIAASPATGRIPHADWIRPVPPALGLVGRAGA